MRKDIQLSARLFNCKVSGIPEACGVVYFLADRGFTPAIRSGPRDIRPVDNIEQRVEEVLIVAQNWSYTKDFGRRQSALFPLPLIVEGLEELIVTASFSFFAPDYFVLDVGGLVDFEFKDQTLYLEPFAQRLHNLTIDLWLEYEPDYGCVDEGYANELDVRGAAKLALPSVSWVNLFGRRYIEKYGEAFLSGIPGCETRVFPNGSLFHQLTPTFAVKDRQEAKKWREEVKDYFSAANRKVTCKAPYTL